jgi:tRNA nucleotidyltransferase (CCA-adding enzyme)
MATMLDLGGDALIDAVRGLPNGALLLDALPADLEPAVHLVGGAVRDLLLDRAPTADLDLVAEGSATAVARALRSRARVRLLRSHDRFGTLTLTLGGANFDIVSARRERYAHPGALPEVESASLEEDLRRRDFTVNAIALALTGPSRGSLHAAPRAIEGLRQRVLAVLHDRSFEDDPTRLLRLARYRGRLGFTVDPKTLELATQALARQGLETISSPRLGNEVRALAREPDPVASFEALHELGADRAVEAGFGFGEDEAAVAARALELLPADGRSDLVALAVAGGGLGGDRLAALLDRLAFEGSDRDVIVAAAVRSEPLARRLGAAQRPSEIARAVNGGGVELVALAGALGTASAAQMAQLWLERLRRVSLAIDGNDLIAAGVREGPAVGVGLRAALAAALDGEASDRERQLAVALRAARGSG